MLIGETYVIDDDNNPVWADQRFLVAVPGGDALDACMLRVEIHDHDAVGGGDFLGQVGSARVQCCNTARPSLHGFASFLARIRFQYPVVV